MSNPPSNPNPRRRSGAPPPRRRPSERAIARAEPSAAQVRLICTAGPKQGEEFPLIEGAEPMVAGRGLDCEISIPDTSVSRRHIQLRKLAVGWTVSDLGSGNGTLVNGEKIAEEAVLRNGDIVTCGDTELTFSDPANMTDRRPVPRRADLPVRAATGRSRAARGAGRRIQLDPAARRKRTILRVLIVLLLVMVGGLAFGVKWKQMQEDAVLAEQRAKEAAERAELAALFQEGKNLVLQGDWRAAQTRFVSLKERDPEFAAADSYLAKAEVEIPNQEQLDAAEEALGAGKVGDARAALAAVDPETSQFQRLRSLQEQLQAKIAERLNVAQEALGAARRAPARSTQQIEGYESVLAITGDVLEAVPNDRDAKVLNGQAEQELARATRKVRRPPPPKPTPWVGVIAEFKQGNLKDAFAQAGRCAGVSRCRSLVTQMRRFQALHAQAGELDEQGLRKLLALDRSITGGSLSALGAQVGKRAAVLFFRRAQAAKDTGRLDEARQMIEQALEADPSHPGARGMKGELLAEARDLYLAGYAVRRTHPDLASDKFKQVIRLTLDSDEYHQKARRRLAELTR